jgi:uncharacterized protein (TIGR02996 family)
MTTHRDAFLQDILENPEDDAPRLIFADWLDEFGDEPDRARAELIRIQCRQDQEGPSRELKARVKQLRGAYIGRWLGSLTGVGLSVEFRRGMVRVGLSATKFLHPHVQRIALEWFPRAGAHELHLCGDLPDPSAVTASPVLAKVHTLHWSAWGLRDEAVRLLVDSPHLGTLKFLQFKGPLLGDIGVGYLAASPHLQQLKGLALIDWARGRGRITLAAAQVLLGGKYLPHLRDLTLSLPPWVWDPQEWQRVLNLPGLARLRSLNLACDGMTNKNVRLLAACPYLTNLTHLNLSGNLLTTAGVEAVLDSPHLQGLQSFRANGKLPPKVQRRLRERFPRVSASGYEP